MRSVVSMRRKEDDMNTYLDADGCDVSVGTHVHARLGDGEWIEGDVKHVIDSGADPVFHVDDGLTTRPVYADQMHVVRPVETDAPAAQLKLLIVGRSASGKDRLAAELERLGLRQLKSCTTRPPRGKDDDSHVFVSEDEAEDLAPKAVAYTEIDKAKYFAMPGQMECSDLYIVDPKGVDDVTRACPDTPFLVVYVRTDDEARRSAAIARRAEFDSAEDIEVREHAESERFTEFEQEIDSLDADDLKPNILCIQQVMNDYRPETMALAADMIAKDKRAIDALFSTVKWAKDEGVLLSTEDGLVALPCVSDEDEETGSDGTGDMVTMTDMSYVAYLMGHPTEFGPLAMEAAKRGALHVGSEEGAE